MCTYAIYWCATHRCNCLPWLACARTGGTCLQDAGPVPRPHAGAGCGRGLFGYRTSVDVAQMWGSATRTPCLDPARDKPQMLPVIWLHNYSVILYSLAVFLQTIVCPPGWPVGLQTPDSTRGTTTAAGREVPMKVMIITVWIRPYMYVTHTVHTIHAYVHPHTTSMLVGSLKATDVCNVPFKWFVLPVVGLILKCWPLYKLVGKLVCTSNKPTVLLPTNLLHVPDRPAWALRNTYMLHVPDRTAWALQDLLEVGLWPSWK